MATVPTPTTQTAGLVVPAATINGQGNLATYLAGRVESGGARRPLCVMRQTVSQNVSNATNTAVTFDTEDVDYDNGHSTVTNTSRYTAGTAGWYHVEWLVSWAPNAAGWRLGWLRTNGVTEIPGTRVELPSAATAVSSMGLGGSRRLFLNAADYVELFVYQSSGGVLGTNASTPTSSLMSTQWISV